MDYVDRWIEQQTTTPLGGILIWLAVLLIRLEVDQLIRRRRERDKQRKHRHPVGG